jgi:hypothetical protein
MSVWKNGPDGRTRRRNKIAGQFSWQSIEALESPAYRALSLSGHRVLARIQIEHARHGGKENGKLPVTFQNFEDYGIHRHAIAPAIRETEALGFIRITQLGRAGNGEFRIPNKFALTHLPTEDGQIAATDDWRRIKTIEEAMVIADAARKAPARFGIFPRKRQPKKQKSSGGIRTSVSGGIRTSTSELPVAETALLSPAETALLSISRGGADTSTVSASAPAANSNDPAPAGAGPSSRPVTCPTAIVQHPSKATYGKRTKPTSGSLCLSKMGPTT